jgi:hypothetical protein
MGKNWRFYSKQNVSKILIITLVFCENGIFRRKLAKIAEIVIKTSTPDDVEALRVHL